MTDIYIGHLVIMLLCTCALFQKAVPQLKPASVEYHYLGHIWQSAESATVLVVREHWIGRHHCIMHSSIEAHQDAIGGEAEHYVKQCAILTVIHWALVTVVSLWRGSWLHGLLHLHLGPHT